jgi:Kef-type K+ transport system membrane component KefB
MVFASVFQQIAVLLLVAAALGAILRILHQPLIVAFIAVGVVAGPSVLGLVQPGEEIDLLAHLGIALLLFIVGLKLDLRLITTLGPVALVTGVGQIVLTAAAGYALATVLGFEPGAALYLALALTLSSTIIVVKLLSDRRQIDQLHGRIALGVLIVQDVAVVVVMIALSAFGQDGAPDLAAELAAVAVRGVAFVAAIALLARFVIPRLLDSFARTPELLVLWAVAWAITLAAAGDLLGFSEEVGAFLAGVSLASSAYREAIGTRLTTLRDFLLLFFFVQLGLGMDFDIGGPQLVPAVVLTVFVLLAKPLFVIAIMGGLRYRRRTSFFTGVSLAQISEFSLIFAALGLELGHIDEDVVGVITTVAVATIAVSSYLIIASRQLFDRIGPLLTVFERRDPRSEQTDDDGFCPEVVIFGLGRFGGRIAAHLAHDGVAVLGVDFDPQALARAERQNLHVLYGDAEDQDMAGRLPLGCARWVVSTSPDPTTNRALIHALRHHGYGGSIAVTAHTDRYASRLEEAGADLVLRPFLDAADVACRSLGYDSAAPEGTAAPRESISPDEPAAIRTSA